MEALGLQAAIDIDSAVQFDDLRRSHADLVLAYEATLEGWARAVELWDKATNGRTQGVADLTVRLARAMGVAEADLVHIRHGALLHDIGNLGIPDAILHKGGLLTENEREVMRQHPVKASDLLSPIPYLHRGRMGRPAGGPSRPSGEDGRAGAPVHPQAGGEALRPQGGGGVPAAGPLNPFGRQGCACQTPAPLSIALTPLPMLYSARDVGP